MKQRRGVTFLRPGGGDSRSANSGSPADTLFGLGGNTSPPTPGLRRVNTDLLFGSVEKVTLCCAVVPLAIGAQ